MPAKKLTRWDATLQAFREVIATVTSAGAANAGDIPALNDSGVFDVTLMPPGIGADTASVLTSEALSAGDCVNIWSNAGTANARKADASTSGKRGMGFVDAAYASGVQAKVFFEGTNANVTGLTPGDQFLSATTPGKVTSTAPTGSGQLVQRVGIATSATSMNAEFDGSPIVLA